MNSLSPTPRFVAAAVPLVFALMAISSVVYIEPAPYDIALLGMLMCFFAAGMRVPREIRVVGLLLGAFVFSNLLASAVAPDPLQTLRSLGIRSYMVLAWLFFVCLVATDPERILPALWKGYLVAALGATVFGVFEYYGFIHNAEWAGGLRAKGPFKDPNVYGPFLVPAVLYCVSQLRHAGTSRRIVYGTLLLAFIFGVLLGPSRGAWLNFSLSLALLLIFILSTRRPRREKVGITLASGLVLAAGAAVVIGAISFTTAGQRFQTGRCLRRATTCGREAASTRSGSPSNARASRRSASTGPHRRGVRPRAAQPLPARHRRGRVDRRALVPGRHRAHPLRRGTRDALVLALRDEFIVAFSAMLGILAQSLFIDSTHWRHLWLMLALCWALITVARRQSRPETRSALATGVTDCTSPVASRSPEVTSVNRNITVMFRLSILLLAVAASAGAASARPVKLLRRACGPRSIP